MPKSYLVASFLRIFCKIKYLICSRRSRNFYQNKNFLYKILETFAHKKTNIFLCNANIIKKDLISEGVDEKKIHVIYNSLDIVDFELNYKSKNDIFINKKIYLICLANFHKYKGHINLLNSLDLIRNDFQNQCHLILIGNDKGFKKKIIDRINELKFNNYVTILEGITNPYPFLYQSDIKFYYFLIKKAFQILFWNI